LYGKLDASNSEIIESAKISNAIEFIDGADQLFAFDESAQSLIKEMEKNKESLCNVIGKDKFEEELAVLKKMEETESKKGNFMAIEGDVDNREKEQPSLIDADLTQGY